MWLSPIAQLLVLGAAGFQVGAGSPVSTGVLPEPIATRQTLFAIPFIIEPAADASRDPVEVQLWVSSNRGASWEIYSKVRPAQRHFVYQAPGDGEYWFSVHTLDRSGGMRPRPSAEPELRVIVDTVLPKLQLEAQRGQGGQITARWRIEDENLKPEALTIQYRTSLDGPWQAVAIDRQKVQTSGAIQTGEVPWWTRDGGGDVQIRVEIADAAGNLAVSHAQVGPSLNVPSMPGLAGGSGTSPWRPGASQPESPGGWPTDHTDATFGRTTQSFPEAGSYQPPPNPVTNPPFSGQSDDRTFSPTGSITSRTNPAFRDQFEPPDEQRGGFPDRAVPEGLRPKMVNSRLFELDYELGQVGSSGVARVELWGTRDGGQTWKSYSLDRDNRSPILVSVDEEGIYGFCVVVTSGAGLGGMPPRRGDPPQVVIGVDQTKPTARIISTEQGTGLESNSLVISWQAADTMLADRPISLFFSENLAGPWTAIATNLPNSGHYAWPVEMLRAQAIYLRLDVRDAAGNLGTSEATQSIVLDRVRPSIQIHGVRPLGQSQRTMPWQNYR